MCDILLSLENLGAFTKIRKYIKFIHNKQMFYSGKPISNANNESITLTVELLENNIGDYRFCSRNPLFGLVTFLSWSFLGFYNENKSNKFLLDWNVLD